jgi:hypothetical protein
MSHRAASRSRRRRAASGRVPLLPRMRPSPRQVVARATPGLRSARRVWRPVDDVAVATSAGQGAVWSGATSATAAGYPLTAGSPRHRAARLSVVRYCLTLVLSSLHSLHPNASLLTGLRPRSAPQVCAPGLRPRSAPQVCAPGLRPRSAPQVCALAACLRLPPLHAQPTTLALATCQRILLGGVSQSICQRASGAIAPCAVIFAQGVRAYNAHVA